MSSNKTPWFTNYYVIIIIVCMLLALFIWFLFRVSISELDKNKETIPKKESVKNQAVYEKETDKVLHIGVNYRHGKPLGGLRVRSADGRHIPN